MELIQHFFEWTQEKMIPNITYDLFKIVLGFIVARFIFEGLIMRWLWGGWEFKVMDGDKIMDSPRKLSPAVARRILKDDGEFSIYAKGVVSPYAWLNIDLISQEAKSAGILEKNEKDKKIIVHIDKNPHKTKQPSNTEILNKIESLEKSVLSRLAPTG